MKDYGEMSDFEKYLPCIDLLKYVNGNLYWRIPGKGRRFDLPVGTKDKNGYVKLSVKGRQLLAHRVIWFIFNGSIPEGMEIDHVNGDRSCNEIKNLRLCNKSENQMNMKLPATNTSGYKDVFVNQGRGKPYRARVRCNNKRFHLGMFDTAEEANAAAINFREEFHGKFCRHE
jgi:hypothetical protein